MMNSKEIRYLLFIASSIIMAIMICITTIKVGNMFGIFVSIMLLALLCIGLGYLYCRYEDKIFVAKPKVEKAEHKVVPAVGAEKKCEKTEESGATQPKIEKNIFGGVKFDIDKTK